VPFPIGSVITVVSGISADVILEGDVDVTLALAGSGPVGELTIAELGMVTLLKVDTDTWIINGVGVTG
jgi:hypothetical protein